MDVGTIIRQWFQGGNILERTLISKPVKDSLFLPQEIGREVSYITFVKRKMLNKKILNLGN